MTIEAYDRNNVLTRIHNVKLPSYCVWDQDSIADTSDNINFEWWISIEKTFLNKKISNDVIKNIINKWKKYYNNTDEGPDEYCSKRMGDHLNCDI
tara:strand:- start:251 stop:535 length:285 start_codon:yes stop_codon:yes gene_type:complete